MGLFRLLSQRPFARRLALAAFGGVLYAVAFCGFDQSYLAWVCLIPVLWALDDTMLSARQAFLTGWTFGFVAHLIGYSWLVGMLTHFGQLPWYLALLGYLLLCLAQTSLFGFLGLGIRAFQRLGVDLVWSTPVLLVVLEWLYPALFPTYLANSQYRQLVLIQSLDIFGPLGLTFLLSLSSTVLYRLLAARFRHNAVPRLALLAFVVLFVSNALYGLVAIANIDDTVAHTDRRLTFGIVQTNMGTAEKHTQRAEGLRRHIQQSVEVERQGADVIVWPESGYNYSLDPSTTNVAESVMGPITKPLLFGGLRRELPSTGRRYYNSAFLADGEGNLVGTYDKINLLAFGEYLPWGDTFPILYDWSPNSAAFSKGESTAPLELDGVRYGVMICYEDILPRFVRRLMAHEPHVLVNLTNDAWFGDTREPIIHLALATFRAVEHRRFLVRATNSGVSAVVDPAGRIVAQTRSFVRANILSDVALLEGTTFYGRVGDAVGMLCLTMLGVWMWLSRRRERARS